VDARTDQNERDNHAIDARAAHLDHATFAQLDAEINKEHHELFEILGKAARSAHSHCVVQHLQCFLLLAHVHELCT
jgi:hypothetical protein